MLLHKSVVHDSRVRREATALVEAGHDVTVLELGPVLPRDADLDGFTRRSVRAPNWLRRVLPFPIYRLAFMVSFAVAVVRLRPEVVHAHDAAMLVPGLVGSRLTGARLVYDSHELATGVPYRAGWPERVVGWIEWICLCRATAVVTVSDGVAARLRARYRLDRIPVVTVRNTCALPRPRADDPPAGLRARAGIAANAPLVLHQGAAAPGRGCESLIRAVAQLPGVHLVFLGTGFEGFDAQLSQVAAGAGAASRVHFVASLGLDRLLAHTREANVGVTLLESSCENHRLALPNKLFEYLAAGVPVLASDLPELRALVLGWRVGWMVTSLNPEALAERLSEALAECHEPALLTRVREADAALDWRWERAGLVALYANGLCACHTAASAPAVAKAPSGPPR
jgi:glycosyltransferase involved in cell wall biosynthesis